MFKRDNWTFAPRVKAAVNHVSNFEDHIAQLAEQRGCTGVMCGHIHTPADKMLGDVHYLNSGDWVESLTAIIEHYDGRMEVVDFDEFVKAFPMPQKQDLDEVISVSPETVSAPKSA